MTIEAGTLVAIASLTVATLATTIGLAVQYGNDRAERRQMTRALDELKDYVHLVVGNGEPGILVRKEQFEPVEAKVEVLSKRSHDIRDEVSIQRGRLDGHELRLNYANEDIRQLKEARP